MQRWYEGIIHTAENKKERLPPEEPGEARSTQAHAKRRGNDSASQRCGLATSGLGVYDGAIFVEGMMARKDRLTRVAVGIGTAMGKADRKAHQVAAAGLMAKQELEDIAKQVEALKRQLQKTTKRLKAALR
jgi:hypothetical protein